MKQPGPSLDRLIEFQKFLLPFHHIERVIALKHQERRESDTEHSFSLALIAWFISAHYPNLDSSRIVMLALAHDIVEIYAGDTFFYGEQSLLDSKAERELAALNQIKQEWPDFKDLTDAIEEYEARKTSEAKFVYALDKVQPMMMVLLAEGKTWQEEHITLDEMYKRKIDKVSLSDEVLPYFEEFVTFLSKNDQLFQGKVTKK